MGWYIDRRCISSVLVAVVLGFGVVRVLGEGGAFKMLRWEEEWRGIDTSGSKVLRQLKDVDLWGDSATVHFGGRLRGRFEGWNNFGWGSSANNSDDFYLHRLQVHGDVYFSDRVRLFAEFINASSTDRELPGARRAVDADEADLLNGFVDIDAELFDGSVTARIGRQQFAFGKQRLVSALPWANAWNKWDGASVILTHQDIHLHSFYGQFVEIARFGFNRPNDENQLFGAYLANGKIFDFYYFGRHGADVTLSNRRHTFGLRRDGVIASTSFDYDGEFAYQFGDQDASDVEALMIATELGYTTIGPTGGLRLWVGFDYASGDSDGGDGDLRTFDQLFPLGHAFLGYLDAIGRQNIIAFNYGISFQIGDKWDFQFANHFFWKAEEEDALYSPAGQAVRAGAPGLGQEIGTELDFLVNYRVSRHLTSSIGYSHFFGGDFIENSGASDDIGFFYSSFQLTF